MARNTTLANALLMLKGEVGDSLVSGVAAAADQTYYTLLDNKQKWLASEWDWPFLRTRVDIAVTAGALDGDRYYTLPTTINFDRPVKVSVLSNSYWHPIEFGIGEKEYNQYSSGDGAVAAVQSYPVQRWDWKAGSDTQIEVWPLASEAQTLRFEGQALPGTLKTGSAYDPSAALDLDDLLVVYFVAAQVLAREKQEDSKIKLAMAEQRLNRVRAGYPQRSGTYVLGGVIDRPNKRNVPIRLIA